MGGTYTIRWWTTFEGGSNLELQRMASQLHNERIRLERITRRSAYLLGFLRDIEINISNLNPSYVGRHSNFTLGSLYTLSDTRFIDIERVNHHHNHYTSPLRISIDNNGNIVPFDSNLSRCGII